MNEEPAGSPAGAKIITVLLADDHPVVRKSLRNELEHAADFKILGEAADGGEAVRLAGELLPEVVVMDIGMPVINGMEATRQIKAAHPDMVVLVLTIYDDAEHILGIFESGADGYLTKSILVEDIIQSIRAAVAGETVLSPNAFQQVLKYALRHTTKPVVLDSGIKLTPREQEILTMLARGGLSNKQIAEELNLGMRTVKSHLADVFGKLNVYSRTEAVIMALRYGFLKVEDLE